VPFSILNLARRLTAEQPLSHTRWLLRRNMTSAAYARTLAGLRTLSQRDRGGAGHVVRALRKAMALTIPKRTCRHSAPMMKIITGAEAGRRRGVRRRNQSPRDSNNTFHPHRWMIARQGAGWQGSWQSEPQRQGRRHHRPPPEVIF